MTCLVREKRGEHARQPATAARRAVAASRRRQQELVQPSADLADVHLDQLVHDATPGRPAQSRWPVSASIARRQLAEPRPISVADGAREDRLQHREIDKRVSALVQRVVAHLLGDDGVAGARRQPPELARPLALFLGVYDERDREPPRVARQLAITPAIPRGAEHWRRRSAGGPKDRGVFRERPGAGERGQDLVRDLTDRRQPALHYAKVELDETNCAP